MKNPYWDGKVHKPVKFGDSFDPQTVEGRKRASRLAGRARRAKAELEALRAEEQSTLNTLVNFEGSNGALSFANLVTDANGPLTLLSGRGRRHPDRLYFRSTARPSES
jgi:hypothetical protein